MHNTTAKKTCFGKDPQRDLCARFALHTHILSLSHMSTPPHTADVLSSGTQSLGETSDESAAPMELELASHSGTALSFVSGSAGTSTPGGVRTRSAFLILILAPRSLLAQRKQERHLGRVPSPGVLILLTIHILPADTWKHRLGWLNTYLTEWEMSWFELYLRRWLLRWFVSRVGVSMCSEWLHILTKS